MYKGLWETRKRTKKRTFRPAPIAEKVSRRSLPGELCTALAALVRSMNCYYSNLIEGHNTHPVDIERALQNDYSNDPHKRDLQLGAAAVATGDRQARRVVAALLEKGVLVSDSPRAALRYVSGSAGIAVDARIVS